jgi:hypothetical protein
MSGVKTIEIIKGPYINEDWIDIKDNKLLIAVKLYNISTMEKLEEIETGSKIYTLQFNKYYNNFALRVQKQFVTCI